MHQQQPMGFPNNAARNGYPGELGYETICESTGMYHHQQATSRDDSSMRLKQLDEINIHIFRFSQNLISLFDELSKDKPTLNRVKQIVNEYIETLKKIESDLLGEINYLGLASTGHPHEGSIYGTKKDYDLAKQRLVLIMTQMQSLSQNLNSNLTA
jgi:mediator of RNA polymerase II transcription subunit 11